MAFCTEELMRLYLADRHDALTERFLAILGHFRDNARPAPSPQYRRHADAFVEDLLFFFTQPDYVIDPKYAHELLGMNPVISDLVAGSRLGGTDPQVEILAGQGRGLLKLLALYSARNTVHIPIKSLFDADPHLTSSWSAVLSGQSGAEVQQGQLERAAPPSPSRSSCAGK